MLASACARGFDGLAAKSFTHNCAQKQTPSRRLPTSQAVLLVNRQTMQLSVDSVWYSGALKEKQLKEDPL